MKKILIGTAVWGSDYCNLFTQLSLPSFLADGNIPHLASYFPIEYHIITTQSDHESIAQHPAINKLKQWAEVVFLPLPTDSLAGHGISAAHASKLGLMNLCHAQFIQSAKELDAGLMIIFPDIISSGNSFIFVADAIKDGKRAVMSGDYMVEKEKFLPQFLAVRDRWTRNNDTVLDIPGRELVGMALNACHPLTAQHCIESTEFSPYPKKIYWHSNTRQAVLTHHWSHDLIFVYPNNYIPPKNTIDNDFIQYALNDFSECVFPETSEELFWIEVSPRDKPRWSRRYRLASPQYVGSWLVNPFNAANHFNALAFCMPQWFLSNGYPPDRDDIEKNSNLFMLQTMIYSKMVKDGSAPFVSPMYEDPINRVDNSLAPAPEDMLELNLLQWSKIEY